MSRCNSACVRRWRASRRSWWPAAWPGPASPAARDAAWRRGGPSADGPTSSGAAGAAGPAGAVVVLANEWGHHVELELGLLQEMAGVEAVLVAACLAGAYVADAAGRELVAGEAVAGLGDFVRSDGDGGHGLGAQRGTM